MFKELNKDCKFALRMTPEDYEVIKKAAKAEGLSTAAYLRQAAYEKLKKNNADLGSDLVVSLTPEEYSAVTKAAAWEGVSPSTYSRLALQRQVKQDLPELMTGGA